MKKNPEFIQYDGPLQKDANVFSCSYKTVEEAKRAILQDIEN